MTIKSMVHVTLTPEEWDREDELMTNQIVNELQASLDDATEVRRLAKEMVELTDVVGAVKHMMMAAFGPLSEARGMNVEVFSRILDECIPELSALVVPTMIEIYTADELRTLVEFYRTPLGRKTISSRDAVSESVQAATGPWRERFTSKLDAAYGTKRDD